MQKFLNFRCLLALKQSQGYNNYFILNFHSKLMYKYSSLLSDQFRRSFSVSVSRYQRQSSYHTSQIKRTSLRRNNSEYKTGPRFSRQLKSKPSLHFERNPTQNYQTSYEPNRQTSYQKSRKYSTQTETSYGEEKNYHSLNQIDYNSICIATSPNEPTNGCQPIRKDRFDKKLYLGKQGRYPTLRGLSQIQNKIKSSLNTKLNI